MIRNLCFVVVLSLWTCKLQAQTNDTHQEKEPDAYFGISTGINNMVGIFGMHLDYKVTRMIFGQAGIGVGTWGYKPTFNIQYRPVASKGMYYKIGYSQAFGVDDYEIELELKNGNEQKVRMDLLKVENLYLGIGKAWGARQGNKIFFDAGAALPITPQDESYRFLSNGIELSSTSEKVMQSLIPGGIMVSFGFMFGL